MRPPSTNSFLLVGCIALLLAVSPTPHASGSETSHTNPTEVVESFGNALTSGDREAALAALSPDVLIFESGGAELSRDEYASHHMGGDMAFVAATTNEITDRTSGQDGDVAWVLTRSTTTGTYKDREIDLTGTETMLLRNTEDGWRIFHIHWSSRSRKSSH